jgi:hypothetical protein
MFNFLLYWPDLRLSLVLVNKKKKRDYLKKSTYEYFGDGTTVATMSGGVLTNDLICNIFKKLPLGDQYETAANFFGSGDSEHMEEFVRRKEYIDGIKSSVYSDVVCEDSCWIQKYGRPLYGNVTTGIICNIKVTGFEESGVPAAGVHKIPVWRQLRKAGLVSDYFLYIGKQVITELENICMSLTVTNIHGSDTEFVATMDTFGYSVYGWGGRIYEGVKDIRFSDPCDFWFGQGKIVAQYPTLYGTQRDYSDGSFLDFCDQPGCAFDDYKIGFDAGVVKQILF